MGHHRHLCPGVHLAAIAAATVGTSCLLSVWFVPANASGAALLPSEIVVFPPGRQWSRQCSFMAGGCISAATCSISGFSATMSKDLMGPIKFVIFYHSVRWRGGPRPICHRSGIACSDGGRIRRHCRNSGRLSCAPSARGNPNFHSHHHFCSFHKSSCLAGARLLDWRTVSGCPRRFVRCRWRRRLFRAYWWVRSRNGVDPVFQARGHPAIWCR